MTILEFKHKAKKRIWNILIRFTRDKKIYPYIYRSFWHYLIFRNDQITENNNTSYYSARPNRGAGIGHQLANWIAGYWYAKQFNLKFAHLPFSNSKWENFLGFGDDEVKVEELAKNGFKIRMLPLFGWNNFDEFELNKLIIRSYTGKKVIFVAEQDQYYMQQYGVAQDIKRKFNQAKSRVNDKIEYNSENFNIAVHVRRTVIIDGKVILEDEAAQSLRWLSNDYYEKVLKQVLDNVNISKPICIYIFSTGKAEEFKEFSKYGDVRFCSDMNEYDSFLHLVKADLLITSKSSFSYKPALMNDGIKICPRNFWHGYPDTPDWILVENDGTFDIEKLKKIL